MAGRPLELDDLKAKRIVDAIADGNSRICAARLAGIAPTTLIQWLRRGRKGEPRFVLFATRVAQADGEAERRMVQAIRDAATDMDKPDWKAAHAWLKAHCKAWQETKTKEPPQADLSELPDEKLLEAAGLVRKVGG